MGKSYFSVCGFLKQKDHSMRKLYSGPESVVKGLQVIFLASPCTMYILTLLEWVLEQKWVIPHEVVSRAGREGIGVKKAKRQLRHKIPRQTQVRNKTVDLNKTNGFLIEIIQILHVHIWYNIIYLLIKWQNNIFKISYSWLGYLQDFWEK